MAKGQFEVRLRWRTPSDDGPYLEVRSALSDDVAAAAWANDGGVDGVCRHVAAVARTIALRFSSHGEGYFATQDDVSCFHAMGVVWITRVGAIFPDIGVRKTFALELGNEFSLGHE